MKNVKKEKKKKKKKCFFSSALHSHDDIYDMNDMNKYEHSNGMALFYYFFYGFYTVGSGGAQLHSSSLSCMELVGFVRTSSRT